MDQGVVSATSARGSNILFRYWFLRPPRVQLANDKPLLVKSCPSPPAFRVIGAYEFYDEYRSA